MSFFPICLIPGFLTLALMTQLLMRVSGVTLLEKSMREGKPGYREYVETISEFFPWFSKKKQF